MTEEEESIIVAQRVKDMPVPFIDCEKNTCSRCGEEVWVSKNLRAYWTRDPIICYPVCLNELLKDDPGPHTIKVPRETLEALERVRGCSREYEGKMTEKKTMKEAVLSRTSTTASTVRRRASDGTRSSSSTTLR